MELELVTLTGERQPITTTLVWDCLFIRIYSVIKIPCIMSLTGCAFERRMFDNRFRIRPRLISLPVTWSHWDGKSAHGNAARPHVRHAVAAERRRADRRRRPDFGCATCGAGITIFFAALLLQTLFVPLLFAAEMEREEGK